MADGLVKHGVEQQQGYFSELDESPTWIEEKWQWDRMGLTWPRMSTYFCHSVLSESRTPLLYQKKKKN